MIRISQAIDFDLIDELNAWVTELADPVDEINDTFRSSAAAFDEANPNRSEFGDRVAGIFDAQEDQVQCESS